MKGGGPDYSGFYCFSIVLCSGVSGFQSANTLMACLGWREVEFQASFKRANTTIGPTEGQLGPRTSSYSFAIHGVSPPIGRAIPKIARSPAGGEKDACDRQGETGGQPGCPWETTHNLPPVSGKLIGAKCKRHPMDKPPPVQARIPKYFKLKARRPTEPPACKSTGRFARSCDGRRMATAKMCI